MMAYVVVERTAEIGVRMALGASASEIARMFTARGLRSAIVGGAFGVALVAAAWRVLATLFYGVTWADTLVVAAAPAALTIVAVLASAIPAFRAARVNPTVALRG